jgi:hypothetical protein
VWCDDQQPVPRQVRYKRKVPVCFTASRRAVRLVSCKKDGQLVSVADDVLSASHHRSTQRLGGIEGTCKFSEAADDRKGTDAFCIFLLA